MKKLIIITITAIFSLGSYAQNDVDVLRYSQTRVGGTARSIAFGGAMGSLGADFSSLSVNPAGIGLFKKSELSVTPTFYFSRLNSDMDGNSSTGEKDNFNMNQYGVVFVNDLRAKKGLKYFQFGIGVNRTNNFNNYYHITNENHDNSMMTDYQIDAYNTDPTDLDPFSTDLAWYNYLLEDTVRVNGGQLAYTSPISEGGVHQELKNITWGSTNEMTISMGSSISDIFYIGGSVGFPFVRYFEQYEYMEQDVADTIQGFDKYFIDQKLETHGSGVNFKLGFIVRPFGFLRFGIAFHSPTWLSLNDEYSARITRFYEDGSQDYKDSPIGRFDYNITTPMKLVGSATFSIARFFLVSADVDYINYSSGMLESGNYSFFDENAEVRDKYKSTLNIRAGAEIRLRPMSFRVGLARYGSPYVDEMNDGSMIVASAGLGYRNRDFFMDLGGSYSLKKEDYYLYDSRIIDAAALEYNEIRIAITAGIKF